MLSFALRSLILPFNRWVYLPVASVAMALNIITRVGNQSPKAKPMSTLVKTISILGIRYNYVFNLRSLHSHLSSFCYLCVCTREVLTLYAIFTLTRCSEMFSISAFISLLIITKIIMF